MFRNYCFRCVAVLLLFIALQVQSQNVETDQHSQGNVLAIHSKVLNEDRKVYVYCPRPDSADVNKRFPVLYIMDADNHFELIAQYVDYLSRPDVLAMPKAIVVGITNTDRRRDLTPTESILDYSGKPDSNNRSKQSGGNENFLQFIRTELIPAIDKNYKTESYRIFAGHSFGGLSAINCMLTHPDMFNAYIAVSPSLWWDNEYLLKFADAKLKNGSALNKKLFYSNGNEGGSNSFFHKALLKLDSTIASKNLTALNYLYKHYPAETHMTVPVIAYYDALRFIFKDWEQPK